jgi:hypothetical protein
MVPTTTLKFGRREMAACFRSTAKSYGITAKFENAPNGITPCTDGESIVLPPMVAKTTREADGLIGIVNHESAHVYFKSPPLFAAELKRLNGLYGKRLLPDEIAAVLNYALDVLDEHCYVKVDKYDRVAETLFQKNINVMDRAGGPMKIIGNPNIPLIDRMLGIPYHLTVSDMVERYCHVLPWTRETKQALSYLVYPGSNWQFVPVLSDRDKQLAAVIPSPVGLASLAQEVFHQAARYQVRVKPEDPNKAAMLKRYEKYGFRAVAVQVESLLKRLYDALPDLPGGGQGGQSNDSSDQSSDQQDNSQSGSGSGQSGDQQQDQQDQQDQSGSDSGTSNSDVDANQDATSQDGKGSDSGDSNERTDQQDTQSGSGSGDESGDDESGDASGDGDGDEDGDGDGDGSEDQSDSGTTNQSQSGGDESSSDQQSDSGGESNQDSNSKGHAKGAGEQKQNAQGDQPRKTFFEQVLSEMQAEAMSDEAAEKLDESPGTYVPMSIAEDRNNNRIGDVYGTPKSGLIDAYVRHSIRRELTKVVDLMLRDDYADGQEPGFRKGFRIKNPERVWKDRRVFTRPVGEGDRSSVALVLDSSSSIEEDVMARINGVAAAFCDAIQGRAEVAVFQFGGNTGRVALKDIGNIYPSGGTPTMRGVEAARKWLIGTKTDKRYMLIVTDGQPSSSDRPHLPKLLYHCRRRDRINVTAMAIDPITPKQVAEFMPNIPIIDGRTVVGLRRGFDKLAATAVRK